MNRFRKIRFLALAAVAAMVIGTVAASSADAGCGFGYGYAQYNTYYTPIVKTYVPTYPVYQTYYSPSYIWSPGCHGHFGY